MSTKLLNMQPSLHCHIVNLSVSVTLAMSNFTSPPMFSLFEWGKQVLKPDLEKSQIYPILVFGANLTHFWISSDIPVFETVGPTKN